MLLAVVVVVVETSWACSLGRGIEGLQGRCSPFGSAAVAVGPTQGYDPKGATDANGDGAVTGIWSLR